MPPTPLLSADLESPGAFAVLAATNHLVAKHQRPCTVREVRAVLPRRSARSVVACLRALHRRGLVHRTWGPHRRGLYCPEGWVPPPVKIPPASAVVFAPTGPNFHLYRNLIPLEASKNEKTPEVKISRPAPQQRGRPKGTQDHAPRRSCAIQLPADGNRERVLALARCWSAGVANVTGRVRRSGGLLGAAPWESPDPKIIRRWNDLVRLDARLLEWGAAPREFCAAAMDYFRWFGTTHLGGTFRPNVRQVSGEKGRGIWLRWRERRKAEGAGSEAWVRQEAARATVSASEKLMVDLRHAVAECRTEGAEWAVTTVWGAEVLWCLWAHEPAARPAVQALLDGELGGGDPAGTAAVRAEVLAIKADPARRQVLARLRQQAVGTAAPVLRRSELPAMTEPASDPPPLPPQISRREWAESGVVVPSERDRERLFRSQMADFLARMRQKKAAEANS